MTRDAVHKSMAERQLDICGPSVASGVALLQPKRHQWGHLAALAVLHRLTARKLHTCSGPHGGALRSFLSQKESYKLLSQSVTCR